MMNKNRTVQFIVLMFFVIGTTLAAAQTVSMQYENGLLSADIQSATIKEIFEELKKQTGLTYEMDKEIEGQKVTVEFKDLSLKAGIEKILDLTGLKDLAISYKEVTRAPGHQVTSQYEISRVEIRKRDPKITDGTSLEGLIQIGLKGERQKRQEIVDKIKLMGREGGLRLLEMAKEEGRDEKERVLAILILGEIRFKDAMQGLTEVLRVDSNEYCREASVLALADMGDTTVIQSFKEALGDKSGNVRQRAVLGLAKLGDKSHSDIALKGIEQGNPTEKLLATMALEEIGDTSVIKELEKELETTRSVWTKINAKLAIKKIELSNIKEDGILEYLRRILKEDNGFGIHSWAALELVKMNTAESLKILEETAGNKEMSGSYVASKVIERRRRNQ